MAKLIVKKGGAKFAELNLVEGNQYLIGRDPSCDIVLEGLKGISRKHLMVKFDEKWTVEIISRMNNLMVDGAITKAAELAVRHVFEVYPYFFSIESEERSNEQKNDNSSSIGTETQPTATHNLPAIQNQARASAPYQGGAGYQALSDEDETLIENQSKRILILSVLGTESGIDSIIQLDDEGPTWIAGRDQNCPVFINDSRASRNHFRITRDLDQFFIEDLGSANGTELNGEHLQPENRQKIVSGDEIKIMSITINVEVRDPFFDQQIELAERGMLTANPYFQSFPQLQALPRSSSVPQGTSLEKAYSRIPINIEAIKGFDWQKHKIRVAIGLGLTVMIVGLLFDGGDKPNRKKSQTTESSSTSVSFDKLKKEQKVVVKDIYNLAKTYYFGMRYELCISEIKKLHKIIPVYEDSKQLLTNCSNGQEILIRDAARKQKEQKKQEALERIDNIVSFCRENIDINTSLGELKTCLSDAIELDPANPQIMALIETIEQRDLERKNAQIQRQQTAKRMAAGRKVFNEAVRLRQNDQLNRAVKQFRKFLSANYPGLRKEKKEATRELASVRAMLNKKIESLLNECEALRSNNQFKQAYNMCDLATKESPESERARSLKAQTLSELRKEMKSIYQDSILEESLGNVDSAKEKWRLILKNDIETDGYYKKAKRKLKKYGEGI